jgi:hypothetical protein
MFNRVGGFGGGAGGGFGPGMGGGFGPGMSGGMGGGQSGFDLSRMPQQAVQNAQGVPFAGQMPQQAFGGQVGQMPQQAMPGGFPPQMPQQAFGGQMPQQAYGPFGQQAGRAQFGMAQFPQQMPQQAFGGFPGGLGGLLAMFGR